jgi:hypothetical protein
METIFDISFKNFDNERLTISIEKGEDGNFYQSSWEKYFDYNVTVEDEDTGISEVYPYTVEENESGVFSCLYEVSDNFYFIENALRKDAEAEFYSNLFKFFTEE